MENLIKPKKGEKYRLTYKHRQSARGYEIASYMFTFMCMRGSKYYFFAENEGIDKTLNKYEFNKYLNNTIESIRNES